MLTKKRPARSAVLGTAKRGCRALRLLSEHAHVEIAGLDGRAVELDVDAKVSFGALKEMKIVYCECFGRVALCENCAFECVFIMI